VTPRPVGVPAAPPGDPRLPPRLEPRPWRRKCGIALPGRRALALALSLTAAGTAALAALHAPLAPLGLAPLLFTAWFFRDPERRPPHDPGCLLSPADGLCDDLRREHGCPWFGGPAVRIGLYLSLLDVHVQRAPCAATATAIAYHRGARVPTARAGATDANEQCATTFTAGHRVAVVRQLAGPVARAIVNVLRAGQQVAAGERFGLIEFGSRVELWLPDVADLRILVRRGQRVRGGLTALAAWPAPAAHRPSPVPVPHGGCP
jgi:phosphatidylserine decarboxylase